MKTGQSHGYNRWGHMHTRQPCRKTKTDMQTVNPSSVGWPWRPLGPEWSSNTKHNLCNYEHGHETGGDKYEHHFTHLPVHFTKLKPLGIIYLLMSLLCSKWQAHKPWGIKGVFEFVFLQEPLTSGFTWLYSELYNLKIKHRSLHSSVLSINQTPGSLLTLGTLMPISPLGLFSSLQTVWPSPPSLLHIHPSELMWDLYRIHWGAFLNKDHSFPKKNFRLQTVKKQWFSSCLCRNNTYNMFMEYRYVFKFWVVGIYFLKWATRLRKEKKTC